MSTAKDSTLDQLVDSLVSAHGNNLASIVLYGSVAAGDPVEPRSDHNLLIALHRITVEDLRLSESTLREWLSRGQPMPVYFTAAELRRAADVFPIEFLQMKKARSVLYGSDPFQSLEISHANLRHQTEYELRTKLIRLRRLYVRASGSNERLAALMSDSLPSVAALFRAVLTLLGHEAPVSNAESVRETIRLLSLEAAPFERIFQLRKRQGPALTEPEGSQVFAAYLSEIERVIDAVDQIAKIEVAT